ncbi:hypothetical protein ACLOJK_034859, partial [Asimina triloba]
MGRVSMGKFTAAWAYMAGQAGAEHPTDHSVITVATHTHRTGQAASGQHGSSKAGVPHDRQPQAASSNPDPATVAIVTEQASQTASK